ncbi:MAG: PQQ-binding-like beta-propeller repeat protein [Alteromonadaceae bacterium]|nr:PQQ-binding-like beta-propeller repeat protein [Alteromonadaceae bacterium]
MKYYIARLSQPLCNLTNLFALFALMSLIFTTEVMADGFFTEVCNSKNKVTLEVGKSGSLDLPTRINTSSIYGPLYNWTSLRLKGSFYSITSGKFTPSSAHLGTNSIVVTHVGSMNANSYYSHSKSYKCTKTLTVVNSSLPTIKFEPNPPLKVNLNSELNLTAKAHDKGKDLIQVNIWKGEYNGNSLINWVLAKACPSSYSAWSSSYSLKENLSCTFKWKANTVGKYQFKIQATDKFGNKSPLVYKSITVKESNTKPTLKFSTNKTTLSYNESLTLTATATDNDKDKNNQLSSITFCHSSKNKNDCQKIAHSCKEKSKQACSTTIELDKDSYVWALADDGHGAVKSKVIKVTIDQKPTVSISVDKYTLLTADSKSNPETIAYTVTPIDDDKSKNLTVKVCYSAVKSKHTSCDNKIRSCYVKSGKKCKGSWQVKLSAGSYHIYAEVTDKIGQSSFSSPVKILTYTGQGTRITSPSVGSSFDAGKSIRVTAQTQSLTNSLNGKLKQVKFYLDGVLTKTVKRSCSATNNKITDKITAYIRVGNGPEHSLTAVATDCGGRISRHSAPVTVNIKKAKPSVPSVKTFSKSISSSGRYTVALNMTAGAKGYFWYEKYKNGVQKYISKTTAVTSTIRLYKKAKENGKYTYCAQAYNYDYKGKILKSAIGTGSKCKSIIVDIVESSPSAPEFKNISLQQAGSYRLKWAQKTGVTAYYELWGSTGSLNRPNWGRLSGGSGTNITEYFQNMPNVGNYSYQLKACNFQKICTTGQQMTINHQAPYLQNAEFNDYFDSTCGANCLVLKGVALTDKSRVSIQVRNSTESFSFSETDLISVDDNTLKVKTNKRIREGLSNGGITIEVSNSIINAKSASIVLDNTGSNERFDLINSAPTLSDNNAIYVGIDHNIYSLKPESGEINVGWPYVTGGDVVAAPTLSKNSNREDIIYVGSKDHNFYALNQYGRLLWKTKTRGEIIASAELDEADQLYVGSMDRSLYAINAENGDIQWQYPFPAGISQKPTLSGDGLLYVTTDDQQIHIIDRRDIGTQALRWQDIDSSLIRESLDKIDNWQPDQGEVPQIKVIARMFFAVLHRSPTKRELTFFAYAKYMGMSLDEIAQAFLDSDQGKINLPKTDSNNVFLNKLYALLFPNGEPDLIAGHDTAHWLAQLDAGYARAAVVVSLVGSTEYGDYADNSVLAVLYYFYGDCQLGHDCEFQGDSDGDGYNDQFEIEQGFNPLDPQDTEIAIPEMTATDPVLGEFTLNITSDAQPTHYKIEESVDEAEFITIAENLQTDSLKLIKTAANYRYQVQACVGEICGQFSNYVEVIVQDSFKEGAVTPESATQTVAPMNAPSKSLIDASARFLLTSGNFRVTENGSASFNLPIALPSGIAGVTPSLSLSYDSQRGESSAGVGWVVSAGSAVSRCRQTQVVDGQFSPLSFDENDRYCLDGQRLILVSHDDSSNPVEGTIGAHYRTEIDNGLKITLETGNTDTETIFKVKGLDGSTRIYGGTTNSTDVRDGVILTWLLSTTTDNLENSSNTINYSYQHDGIGENEIVLSSIEYSGNSVVLNYQAGRVRTSTYLKGELVTSNAELTSIEVYNHNNENIRDYLLEYQTNSIDKRELTSIKECRGTVCKQPIDFTYRPTLDSSEGMFAQTSNLFNGTNDLAGAIVQDVNSDGENDLITLEHLKKKTYELCVKLSAKPECISFQIDTKNDNVPMVLTDTDNDGWLEILVMVQDYDDKDYFTDFWEKITFTDGKLNQPVAIDDYTNKHNESLRSFDFDGDGHNDLISNFEDKIKINYWKASEQSYSRMFTLDDFSGNGTWRIKKGDMFKGGWYASDFNGDGRGDIIAWACENTCKGDTKGDKLQLFTSNGDDLSLYNKIRVRGHSLITADLNGDGYTDILLYNTDYKRWQVFLNKGNKGNKENASNNSSNFTSEYLPQTVDIKFSSDISPALTDIDLDGNIDIVMYANNSWYAVEWSPKDNDFIFNNEALITDSINIEAGDSAYFTDWDNDGRQDFIIKRSKSVISHMNVYAPTIPGLLEEVTQVNGLNTSIQYGSMSDETLYEKGNKANLQDSAGRARTLDIIGNMPLVQSVTSVTPSSADVYATSIVQYKYKGAQTQLGGRGWLGFNEIIITSKKDGETLTNTTKFKQDFPYIGMVAHGQQFLSGLNAAISENGSHYKLIINEGLNEGTAYYRIFADDTRSCQANVSRGSNENLSISGYICNQILQKQNNAGDVTQTITSSYLKSSSADFMEHAGSWYTTYPQIFPLPIYSEEEQNLVVLSDWLSQTNVSNEYIKAGRLSHAKVVHSREGQADITRESAFTYYSQGHQSEDMLWQEVVEPDGDCSTYLKTTHTYDTWGNKIKGRVTNKAGCDETINRAVTTNFDDEGRYPTSVSNNSFTSKTVLSRNALGQPTKISNVDGVESAMVYDTFGTLVYSYNASGSQSAKLNQACVFANCYMQVASSKNGEILQTTYMDMAGRVFQKDVVNVLGSTHSSYQLFDSYGRPISTEGPGLLPVTKSYDIFDRLINEIDDNTGITTSIEIDGLSHTTTLSGNLPGDIQSTITTLNSLGENTSVTDNLGNKLSYTYNSLGKLTAVHNSADEMVTVKNTYDILGRKTQMIDKDMGTWRYKYNALGQMKEQTDARSNKTTIRYDNLGRKIQQKVTGEQTSVWKYASNQLVSESAGEWQRNYYYDALGRNVAVLTSLDNSTDCTAGVAYNSTSNDLRITQSTLTDPVASRCVIQQSNFDSYSRLWQKFDDYRRLSTDEFIEARGIKYHYAHGQVLKQQEAREGELGRVYSETLSLNNFGGVSSYNKGLRTITLSTDNAGRTSGISSGIDDFIQQDSYGYDGIGNLTKRTLTTQEEQSFGYDNANRIIKVNNVQLYHYKKNGNFDSKNGWSHKYAESVNGTAQPLHAVTSRKKNDVTERFVYDANGNQIKAEKNGVNWRNITYSGRNKATYIEEDGEITRFSYDANNNRYKRTNGNQVIYYVGALELTIQSETQSLPAETYIKRAIAGQALQTYYSSGNAHLKWLYKDILGSLVAITNEQGKLLKRFKYDVFGKQQELIPSDVDRLLYYDLDDTMSVLASVPMNIRGYTGHEPVGTNGRIIHMNGRIYDAMLGRFLQADPFIQAPTDSQSYNRYAYVRNNPLTLIDPSGYSWLSKAWKKIKPFIGAIV